MTGPERPRVRGTRDRRPEDTPSSEPAEKPDERPARSGDDKKSPEFRLARLDGRDTLKYEDTADK